MEIMREGNIILAKMEDGLSLQKGILDVIDEEEVYSGIVVYGIGMLKDSVLSYFEKGRYVETQRPKPMELLSLQGSIVSDSSMHLHATMADKENKAYGGHLSSATVHNMLEMAIIRFDSMNISRRNKSGEKSVGLSLSAGKRKLEMKSYVGFK